jgi:alkylhydroperoxidase family enzyme
MAFIETTPEGDASGAVAKLSSGIVDDATSVSEADVERLRRLGLSDDEIFDVAAAAAARCFFSKTLDALDAQPDAAYAELDPELREVLAVGHPIAQS